MARAYREETDYNDEFGDEQLGLGLAVPSTNDFKLSEFRCRDKNRTPVPSKYYANVQELMDNLQVLRNYLGKPVIVNSGYRTPSYNAIVKGKKNSQHLYARAADIKVKGITPRKIHETLERLIAAGRVKQGGLGLYSSFVHYDVRGKKARWLGSGVKSVGSAYLENIPSPDFGYQQAAPNNLIHITHAGTYRLAYDRLTKYGIIEPLPGRNKRRFRGIPALKTALDNWANNVPTVLSSAPAYILTGGLYVNKSGQHGLGKAIDVDGFWWSANKKFMALDAPTNWDLYLAIEASLRRVFGTVLNYDYNRKHRDHWHCDLGTRTSWRRVTSQAKFAQRALNEIWGEKLMIDGKWGKKSNAAAIKAGYDFSASGGWEHFLNDIMNGQSTP